VRSDLLDRERRGRHRRRLLVAVVAAVVVAVGLLLPRDLLWRVSTAPEAGRGAAPVVSAPVRPAAVAAPPPPASPTPAATLKTRPLSAWLSDIARDAERDLVISPELRGDLTASETSALGWKERLEAYARVFGFEAVVSEGLIEARRFGDGRRGGGSRAESTGDGSPVAATAESSAASRESSAAGATPGRESPGSAAAPKAEEPPPQTRVVRLSYASAKESAVVLSKASDDLEVTVTADVSANAVVLTGQPSAIGRVVSVIGELDRPRRRILLEAKMVEVTRSARLDLGVEWKLTGTTVGADVKFPPPATDAGSAALVIATHGASALDARISALEASGKLRVVSRPSVVMMEGSPATIESVRILRIRLPSNGTVVGDDVVQAPSNGRATEDIPVGVRLEVTPAIRGGGKVLLRIKAKSSSLGAPLPPDNIPEELSRMVDAEVLVTNGETAVLGGLLRESGTNSGAGVPGLRKVPMFGLLFGRKSDAKEEEELLVLVTPRVLD